MSSFENYSQRRRRRSFPAPPTWQLRGSQPFKANWQTFGPILSLGTADTPRPLKFQEVHPIVRDSSDRDHPPCTLRAAANRSLLGCSPSLIVQEAGPSRNQGLEGFR